MHKAIGRPSANEGKSPVDGTADGSNALRSAVAARLADQQAGALPAA